MLPVPCEPYPIESSALKTGPVPRNLYRTCPFPRDLLHARPFPGNPFHFFKKSLFITCFRLKSDIKTQKIKKLEQVYF